MSQEQGFEPSYTNFCTGVSALTMAGQLDSGDQATIRFFSGGGLTGVADGLGHGEHAFTAAKRAMSVLESSAGQNTVDLMLECHEALRRTRGAVLSLASFQLYAQNGQDNSCPWEMTWLGVGNVKGVLIRADEEPSSKHEWLLARGGVVGYQIPSLRPVTLPFYPGDTLIFATDGIHSHFTDALSLAPFRVLENPAQAVSDYILENFRRGTDDALVLALRRER